MSDFKSNSDSLRLIPKLNHKKDFSLKQLKNNFSRNFLESESQQKYFVSPSPITNKNSSTQCYNIDKKDENEISYKSNIKNQILEKPIVKIKKTKIINQNSEKDLKYVKKHLLILEEILNKKQLDNKKKIKKQISQILLPNIKDNKENNLSDNLEQYKENEINENFALVMYPLRSSKSKIQITKKMSILDLQKEEKSDNKDSKLSYKNLMKIPNNRVYIPNSFSSSNLKPNKNSFNELSNELLFQLKSRRASDLKFLERIKHSIQKKQNNDFNSCILSYYDKSFNDLKKINKEKLKKMRNKSYINLMNMINYNSNEIEKINNEINHKLDINKLEIFQNQGKFTKY